MKTASIKQIAEALGQQKRKLERLAKKESWPYTEEKANGGKRRLYQLVDLPLNIQSALLKAFPEKIDVSSAPAADIKAVEDFSYNAESLWDTFNVKSNKQKNVAKDRLAAVHAALSLVTNNGISRTQAFKKIAETYSIDTDTVRRWYNKCCKYNKSDWLAALAPGHMGSQPSAEVSPEAWDWLKGQYLNRREPHFTDSYLRLEEIAQKENWIIPSEKTLERHMKSKVSVATRVLLREGPEALNKLYPSQQRDKTCFAAGEAVTGDGLKFDKLYVDWGDEIIKTSTGWFWQDLRTNKLLAHRIAKTENTDMFRLATYDLTGVCSPSYAQLDNTRVAANKAMSGGAKIRYRFKDKPDDHLGLLLQLGIQPHFTNPDHTMSNPGVKPIERSFGIGGIHDMVATHPRIINRGFSMKTAIPVEEFMEIVAEEVKRFNARPKRRTDVCRGVLSFDDAFNESFAKATVRKATEAQRRLLLLMPERIRAATRNGEITLKAGAGPHGKNRYWIEALTEFKGQQLVGYYDPENLSKDLAVYTLDGRFICDAEHKPSVAFNNTKESREHAKYKKRTMNSQKSIAANEIRMSALERAALYPKPDDVVVPEPGIVQGNFKQKRKVLDDGTLVDTESGEVMTSVEGQDFDDSFENTVLDMAEVWKAKVNDGI